MRTSFLLLVLVAMSLPACNTVKGVGKDIHDSAQAVQIWIEGSEENKQNVDSRSVRAPMDSTARR